MMDEGAGQRPAASMITAAEGNLAANKVIFYSQAYTALIEQAHAAMPGEAVGVLLGDTQPVPAGKLWVTVTDVAPVRPASNDTVEAHLDRLRHLVERLGRRESSSKIVGWFYADPGTGLFPPRLPIAEVQRVIPDSATLFLLANPATDQGAFFWWDGTSYAEADGFYEAVPDESFSPVVTWDGEVRGVKAWFGGLLGMAAHSAGEPAHPVGALIEQPVGEGGEDYSAPVYVEVITEEPVEYVPPEATPPSAQSEAPLSTDTQPYPVQPEHGGAGVIEDAPPREGPSTIHLGAMTGKLEGSEEQPEPSSILGAMTGKLDGDGGQPEPPSSSPDDEPPNVSHTSTQTGPLDAALITAGADPADTEAHPGEPTGESVAGEPDTTHEVDRQSDPTATQVRASTVLAPVAHSSVRPVMQGRNRRELVFTVLGLVAVAIVLILLLGGLPAPPSNPSPASPPASTGPSFNQDNAQAGDASDPGTALPDATITITVTNPPLPSVP